MRTTCTPAYYKATAIVLFLICLVPQLTWALAPYQTGEKLFVAPTTGVNIRTEPSLRAPVLAQLPYNTAVTLLTDSLAAAPLEVKVSDFKGGFLPLQGQWVKVKAGKLTGFVFDGMLTPFKGLQLGEHQEDLYYAATFGQPSKTVIPKSEEVAGRKLRYETVITTYPNGLEQEYTFFDDCHDLKYTFSMPFNEAYWIIARMMVGADAAQEAQITQEDGKTVFTFYSCT